MPSGSWARSPGSRTRAVGARPVRLPRTFSRPSRRPRPPAKQHVRDDLRRAAGPVRPDGDRGRQGDAGPKPGGTPGRRAARPRRPAVLARNLDARHDRRGKRRQPGLRPLGLPVAPAHDRRPLPDQPLLQRLQQHRQLHRPDPGAGHHRQQPGVQDGRSAVPAVPGAVHGGLGSRLDLVDMRLQRALGRHHEPDLESDHRAAGLHLPAGPVADGVDLRLPGRRRRQPERRAKHLAVQLQLRELRPTAV